MNSKVSICIPAYRQPEKLKRCLDSILQQTYPNYEIIVSDDSPENDVQKLVNSYLPTVRILYTHNSPAKGTPENWNEAIRLASGDFIIVLHHDDWFYLPETLETLLKTAEENAVDFVFAQSYSINERNEIIGKNDPDQKKLKWMRKEVRRLFYHNWIGAPSAVLLRRKDLYYDPNLKWLVDVEFYMRYIGKGTFYYSQKAIVGIGISGSQVTQACIGKAEVELTENDYVYQRLNGKLTHLFSDFIHFYHLFRHLRMAHNDFRKFKLHPLVKMFYQGYRLISVFRK